MPYFVYKQIFKKLSDRNGEKVLSDILSEEIGIAKNSMRLKNMIKNQKNAVETPSIFI